MVVELEEEGVKGVGECTPYPRYGESDASVLAQIMSIVPQLEQGLTREALQKLLPAGATQKCGRLRAVGSERSPAAANAGGVCGR